MKTFKLNENGIARLTSFKNELEKDNYSIDDEHKSIYVCLWSCVDGKVSTVCVFNTNNLSIEQIKNRAIKQVVSTMESDVVRKDCKFTDSGFYYCSAAKHGTSITKSDIDV